MRANHWVIHYWKAILLLSALLLTLGRAPAQQKPLLTSQSSSDEAFALLNRAKALALGIKNSFQRGALIEKIGVAQARGGALNAALETANHAYPSGTAIFDAIGDALAESNDLTRAESLGRKLKRGGPSAFLSDMARSQAKKGKIEEALKTAELISFLEVRSYVLEEIAMRQAAEGDEAGARKTFALARAAHQKGPLSSEDLEMAFIAGQLSRGEDEQVRKTIASWEPDRKFSAIIGGAEQLQKQRDNVRARAWLRDGFQELPTGPYFEFFRYYAIPILVRVGEKERAMEIAGGFSGEMRMKGYMAVAVTCAEEKDLKCVDIALEGMQSVATSDSAKHNISEFVLKMMILNVTAALVDNNQFEAASRWLSVVEEPTDDYQFIKPRTQLQRVVMSAHKGNFEDAHSVASQMRPNSITDLERGEALRITALLQTRASGSYSSRSWAAALSDKEDRAYAFLGIAQALLGIGEVKLPYSTIQIH
jgi:hypothetical protein